MTKNPGFVNLCHLFDFSHPKNQLGKYTPPYGTAWGDPILMEGNVCYVKILFTNLLRLPNNTCFIGIVKNCLFPQNWGKTIMVQFF